MVKAQEHLDKNYSNKSEVKEIDLRDLSFNQPEKLVIDDYPNLKWIYGENIFKLPQLTISNCFQLEEISITNSTLSSLILNNLPNLKKLNCYENNLTALNINNCNDLKKTDCSDNNLNQDLSFLSHLMNLEYLQLGNNKLIGNLEPLRNLQKLKQLDISDTDINSGLEYLPESVKDFGCLAYKRKDAKCQTIYNLFANEQEKVETENGWIKTFPQRLQNLKDNWTNLNFTNEEMKLWTKAGAKLNDAKFIAWLKNTKNLTLEWITNYKEDYQELSNRFKKYGLCFECNQLNTGEKWCQNCNSKRLKQNFLNWTSKNPQIDQFIQKYQLEATEANKFLEWIPYEQFSNIEYLAQGGFGKVYKVRWKEGNILYWDAKNKQWQREKDNKNNNVENQKKEIQELEEQKKVLHIKISSPFWIFQKEKSKEELKLINKKIEQKKDKVYKVVVLKDLNNSSANTEFLQETANHKIIDDWFNNIVPCYGLSQDPQTKNYIMVMQYIEGGDLRKYLKTKNLTFQDKLKRLTNIIQGLKDVHSKNLVHRDFHSGNILNNKIHSFITDLGLCKPVGEANKEAEIYGVLPYVAPEVLRKKGYTPASDIYSLGIVAYEIFANASPYLDREYDTLLAVEICQGLRPDLDKIKIPLMLKNLIKQCWENNLEKRPTANEIERTSRNWQQNPEFIQQIQTIEKEYNQESQNTEYKFHPTATMNSKLINTKEITRLLSQSQSGQIYEQSTSKQVYFEDSSDLESCAINLETEQQAQILQQNPPKTN